MYILRKYAHIYSYLTVYKNIYNIISVAVVMPSGRQNGYTAQLRSPVLAAGKYHCCTVSNSHPDTTCKRAVFSNTDNSDRRTDGNYSRGAFIKVVDRDIY